MLYLITGEEADQSLLGLGLDPATLEALPSCPLGERCLPAQTLTCRQVAQRCDNPWSFIHSSLVALPACLWKSNSSAAMEKFTFQHLAASGSCTNANCVYSEPFTCWFHTELLSKKQTTEWPNATACRTEPSHSHFLIFLTKFLLSACLLLMLFWGIRLVTHEWKLRITFPLWRTSWMTGLWVLNDSNPLTSYGRAFEFDVFINTNLFILNVCCLRKSLLALTHV